MRVLFAEESRETEGMSNFNFFLLLMLISHTKLMLLLPLDVAASMMLLFNVKKLTKKFF